MLKRIPRGTSAVVGLLLAVPSAALAADPEGLPTLGQAALRSIAALGAVLALIALLAYLFKRVRQSSPVVSNQGPVSSVARIDLGGRREIRLVRAADRYLVVGVTADRIDILSDRPAPAEAARTEDVPELPGHPALQVLRKLASS